MSTARSASGRLNAPASATRRPSHRPGAAPISAGIEGSLTAGGYLCELTIAPSVPRRFVLRAAPRCWLTGLSFIPEGAGRHRGHREWQHRPPLCGSPCRTREPSRRPRNRRPQRRSERPPVPTPLGRPNSGGARSFIGNATTPPPLAPPVTSEFLMPAPATGLVSQPK